MSLHVITTEEFLPFVQRLERLEKDNATLKRLAKKHVGTDEAMEVTGLSRSKLDYERVRPGTLIRFAKKGTKVLYELQSLLDYNDSKELPTPSKSHLKIAY